MSARRFLQLLSLFLQIPYTGDYKMDYTCKNFLEETSMGHPVVPEISKRSKWWIPKYRFLELKYFCLQYPEWKREAAELLLRPGQTRIQNGVRGQVEFADSTGNIAVRLLALHSKIALIDKVASEIDPPLSEFILKAVTEGVSFIKLKTMYEIPCERDMYYDRYRKFFYILNGFRE